MTTADPKQVRTRQVANILKKLESGKPLTAREEAILAREHAAAAAGSEDTDASATETPSGYAKTWDELAQACSVDRRTLTNVRLRHAKDPKLPRDRADGRKDIAAWILFLSEIDVQGRGVNNDSIDFLEEKQLRLEERRLAVEIKRHELRCAKDQMAPISHFEAALGQMLAAFRQALDSLPGRIAGGIDEADSAELIKLLERAEKEKMSVKTLRAMIKGGKVRPFADVHARRQLVQDEVDAVKRALVQCEYMEADPGCDDE